MPLPLIFHFVLLIENKCAEILNCSLKCLNLGLLRQYNVFATAFHAGQVFESEGIIVIYCLSPIAFICLAMIG